jgi:hypothetical protein
MVPKTSPSDSGEMPASDMVPETGMLQTASSDAISTSNSSHLSLDETMKELDSLRAALKKANAEAASHRHKAKELDDLKARAEQEKLSDLERISKRAEAAEQKASIYQQRLAAMAVQLEAQRLGIVDPDVAATLVASQLEYGDDGMPANAKQLLQELLKAKPYLEGPNESSQPSRMNPGATNPARVSTGNALPPVITATQYLDRTFQSEFRRKYGVTLFQAVSNGHVKLTENR